jgi:hypothetical protein
MDIDTRRGPGHELRQGQGQGQGQDKDVYHLNVKNASKFFYNV